LSTLTPDYIQVFFGTSILIGALKVLPLQDFGNTIFGLIEAGIMAGVVGDRPGINSRLERGMYESSYIGITMVKNLVTVFD